jgi:hypothetical protein
MESTSHKLENESETAEAFNMRDQPSQRYRNKTTLAVKTRWAQAAREFLSVGSARGGAVVELYHERAR